VRALIIGAACVLACSARAGAQQPYGGTATPQAGALEAGGSVSYIQGYDAGSRPAQETSNSTTGAPPLTLFATSSRVAPSIGAEARLGVYLTGRVSVEGALQFSRPALRTRISDDFENAAPLTAEETATSYVVTGSLLYHFGNGPVSPFVSGGGGYVRQLHEDNTEVVTGTEFHGGGGVNVWLGSARRLAVRLDAQASSRSRSVGFEDKRQLLATVGGGVSFRF
jgi:hypothetical protein